MLFQQNIGRIPYKITSGFSSLRADQWKNWTIIFSQMALKPVIPNEHYQLWCIFVQVCQLVCSRTISKVNIMTLDRLLISFCEKFEELFGCSASTPNLHLHGHFTDCLFDYGPSTSFWLFALERLNGILGSVPTNHQSIEIQLM